jgi:hypothetical protein
MEVRVWNWGVDTGGGGGVNGGAGGREWAGLVVLYRRSIKRKLRLSPSVGFVSTPLPPSTRIKKRGPPALQGEERVREM